MEPGVPGLVGSEIHGFKTMEDLDVPNMMEEAKTRWLRPNEIHAVLYNHKHFQISVKPVNLPPSGTIVLFDRKMLRNFRKDGHNWKKKKDGKTVKEAHEHLKVGNNERIHVYYAHGEDRSTLVRRCYWLLDKNLEHIVLVHYRDTQELQGSPMMTVDSNSSSDPPTSSNLSEEIDGVDQVYFTEPNETVINHEMRIHELNTLEWDELVIPTDSNKPIPSAGGNVAQFDQINQYTLNGSVDNVGRHNNAQIANLGIDVLDTMRKDGLPAQESFGRWMNYIITDSPGSIDDPLQDPFTTFNGDHHATDKIFNITDVSPAWALTSEETKARNSLMELTLQNRLLEWLLERLLEGGKIPDRDDEGQGVIHLCAILDYNWAIYPYSWSGLSLDFRDKFGWTALHWAAHLGRQRMVASLLSAGANPNLVTDPTSENPSGCTPADLASKNGYEGLAAYLAEKALVAHFEAMTVAGNVSGSLQSTFPTNEPVVPDTSSINVSEEEQYLKDTLAAYRTAADAAARIQAAFREQSFKLRTKEVEVSNPEDEARCIIAAMRIQHAFRNHETKKQMQAAVRIQYRFRTWKIRKDFLNKRRQAIRIQSIFRGHQVRRQYTKIVWSVGVLEKAILRWRLKRKGFRGLQVDADKDEKQENADGQEGFFHASRKQAEERVERSVVRVQAMFRSKLAQEEYRKMKLQHIQASIEYNESFDPATNMEK